MGNSSPVSRKELLLRGARAATTAGIAIVAACVAFLLIEKPHDHGDFVQLWSAARTVLHSGNPYLPFFADVRPVQPISSFPLPAILLLAPIAWLPLAVGGAIFVGISSGLLSWGILSRSPHLAPILISAPFLLSIALAGWSPLIVAGVFVPWAAISFPARPNLGLPLWIASPNVRAVAAGAAILLVSLVVMPRWPLDWVRTLPDFDRMSVPLLRPFGGILLLSIAGWRSREGRLLLVMSLLPQTLAFADQLPLWLVARSLRQSLLLSLFSMVALLMWIHRVDFDGSSYRGGATYAFSLYFAALAVLGWNIYCERRARRTEIGASVATTLSSIHTTPPQ